MLRALLADRPRGTRRAFCDLLRVFAGIHGLLLDLDGVLYVENDEVKRDFAELQETTAETGADAVIIGDLGAAFGYEVRNRAFRQVMDGAELIALQQNRYWLTADGLSLDAGPFVAAIEYATARDAYVVGKPAPAFFEEVVRGMGLEAGAAAMVGA